MTSARPETDIIFCCHSANTLGSSIAFWMVSQLPKQRIAMDASAAAMTEDWPLPAEWGTVTLKEGGELYVEVKESELVFFDGKMPFEVQVQTELQPLDLAGRAADFVH